MDKDSAAAGLERYLEAQDPVFSRVVDELRRGRKSSHWMWFIFPQIKGLGRSPMSERFAIRCLEEARAYARHPVLGTRLRLVAFRASLPGQQRGPGTFRPRARQILCGRARPAYPRATSRDIAIDGANIADRERQFDLGQARGLPSREVSECNSFPSVSIGRS
jgi:hypothetical protein